MMATTAYTLAYKLFKYVKVNHHKTWIKMHHIIRPHKMNSVIKHFSKHLTEIQDLDIFNNFIHNIPSFLLQFCKTIKRNDLMPGDAYGILLTCRCTKVCTQDTLDKRHLKDDCSALVGCPYEIEQKLRFELNIYNSISQIYEISNKRKFTTFFVENISVDKLLTLDDACYLSMGRNTAHTLTQKNVYVHLKKFVITKSFLPGILKILTSKSEDREYIFRHVNIRNIIAFTDLKFIFKKCGIICYFFNLIRVVKLQFFKNLHPTGRNYKDLSNIFKFQCYTGEPLPLNRTGLKKNPHRSGLEKLCFEAVKQNYVSESIKNKTYPVDDSISKIYFGQQFNEGTGYKFCILNKE